ncbi:hypothetical protein Skr01_59190 [Sphaerisporangium krabiense]|nr:hypothetical protein Skr01_59190 [Sphaerisporangium krabiense]
MRGRLPEGWDHVVYTNYDPVGLSEVSARHDAGGLPAYDVRGDLFP